MKRTATRRDLVMSALQPPASSLRRDRPGFTLLEVLVAVAIFAIVGMLAMAGYNELITQSDIVERSASRTRAVQSAISA